MGHYDEWYEEEAALARSEDAKRRDNEFDAKLQNLNNAMFKDKISLKEHDLGASILRLQKLGLI